MNPTLIRRSCFHWLNVQSALNIVIYFIGNEQHPQESEPAPVLQVFLLRHVSVRVRHRGIESFHLVLSHECQH